jgi:hypothetical protein
MIHETIILLMFWSFHQKVCLSELNSAGEQCCIISHVFFEGAGDPRSN